MPFSGDTPFAMVYEKTSYPLTSLNEKSSYQLNITIPDINYGPRISTFKSFFALIAVFFID